MAPQQADPGPRTTAYRKFGSAFPARGPLTACLLGCLLAVSAAPAQGPEEILYNRQSVFRIPFDLMSGGRLREVHLFVSEDQGQTWRYSSTARPPQQEFIFKAEHDGLYWFTTQTIGLDNRRYPHTLEGVRPDLRVCVDSKPPTVLLRALPTQDGRVGVEWEVRDENLNLASLRLEFRVAPSAEWQPLPVEAVASNQRYWNPGTSAPVEVRLRVSDRADNLAEETTVVNSGGRSIHYGGGLPEQGYARPKTPAEAPLRLVNSNKIRVRYDIKEVGRSGVSDIELWYITDRTGRLWQKLKQFNGKEYANQEPILEFEVPGEGRYGFTLVVRSGVHLGGQPPKNGDAPQFWVEVDTTPPAVRIQDPVMGRGTDTGKLFIKWTATDKNLSSQSSITLSYVECNDSQPEAQPEGPWRPIVADLDNTGSYTWTLNPEVPNRILVKVEAKDRAGNLGNAVSKPVTVDLSEPKGIIVNVEPVPKG